LPFKCNLQRYNTDLRFLANPYPLYKHPVGLCTLNQVDP
jgi:hypothetical protein